MKILLDMNLSPSWISIQEAEGYETRHWNQIGAPNAPDVEMMRWARTNGFNILGFVIFTHDLDYGAILYATHAIAPSVIQIRMEDIRPQNASKLLLQVLCKAEKQIDQGALITLDARKSRIHLLPLRSESNH